MFFEQFYHFTLNLIVTLSIPNEYTNSNVDNTIFSAEPCAYDNEAQNFFIDLRRVSRKLILTKVLGEEISMDQANQRYFL